MRLARGLERRLEALFDGVAGRMFRGPLHPTELATRLLRHADLETEDTELGPRAPNRFTVRVSPQDLGEGTAALDRLTTELARAVEETSWERGWRLEGPVEVSVDADPELPPGVVRVSAEVAPGTRPAWAILQGSEAVPVTVNRAVLGRASNADARISHPEVSRRHALVWREDGRVLAQDLGSANGTWVDGEPCRDRPVPVERGSVLTLGPVRLRFEPR